MALELDARPGHEGNYGMTNILRGARMAEIGSQP